MLWNLDHLLDKLINSSFIYRKLPQFLILSSIAGTMPDSIGFTNISQSYWLSFSEEINIFKNHHFYFFIILVKYPFLSLLKNTGEN